MKHLKPFLAFALGCVAAIAFGGVAADVTAQRSTPGGGPGQPASLESRLLALEQRARDLEQAAGAGQVGKKVVAPFEVVDLLEGPIFDVDPKHGVHVYGGGKLMAVMSAADNGGGNFAATTGSGDLVVRFSASPGQPGLGLEVSENHQERIQLGRDDKLGNYRLKFLSGTEQVIATIGESPNTHTGLALVYDKSGSLRARMAVSEAGKGLVDVLAGESSVLAQLSEGPHKGGRLLICGINSGTSCSPAMVEAGDAGGYGIVRAGPQGFNPGVTMLGLPGSVIAGKQ